MFLSKQVQTIVAGRQRDAQRIKVEILGAYTLLRRFSKPPGAKRPSAWLSLISWKIGFHYSDRSNPAEEIGIPEC